MKTDGDVRALLDALCAWLVEDAQFVPGYVERLRARFEARLRDVTFATKQADGKSAGEKR